MAKQPFENVVHHLFQIAARAEFKSLDDQELLKRYVEGRDNLAFGELVRRYKGMVWYVCWRVLRHHQDVEDAFQATVMTLVHRAKTILGRAPIEGWLHSTAFKIASAAKRDRARRHAREERSAKMHGEKYESPDCRRELGEVLDKELIGIPEKYRIPLLLCYLEELPQKEAAQRLGISIDALDRRLRQGREQLKKRLSKYGMELGPTMMAQPVPGVHVPQVPIGLVERTLDMARVMTLANGALETAAISPQVTALVKGALGVWTLKVKLCLGTVLLTLAGVGAGVARYPSFFLNLMGWEPPQEKTQALDNITVEETQADPMPPRKDLYGDPLPPQALTRLGSLRFRGGGLIAFTPDSKGIGLLKPGERPRLLDISTGKYLDSHKSMPMGNVLKGPLLRASCCLSPDGRWIAGFAGNGNLSVWETATGNFVRAFQVKNNMSVNYVFSPNSKYLLVADPKKRGVYFWDIASGKDLWTQPRKIRDRLALAISPTGAIVAQGGPDGSRLYDARTGRFLRKLGHPWPVANFAFSPDGRTLAIGYESKRTEKPKAFVPASVYLWDVATGKEQRRLTDSAGGDGSVHFRQPMFSPDGKMIAVIAAKGGGCGAIGLWEVATGKPIRSCQKNRNDWTCDNMVEDLTFSPDGKILAGQQGGVLYCWEVSSGKLLESPMFGHEAVVTAVHFTADGQRLVTADYRQAIHVWDARTGQKQVTLREESRRRKERGYRFYDMDAHAVVVSRAGKTLVAGLCMDVPGKPSWNTARGSIGLWDATTGQELRRLPWDTSELIGWHAHKMVASPDGRFVAFCIEVGELRKVVLWEIASGQHHCKIEGMEPVFSPDGKLLLTCSNAELLLWDVATGDKVAYVSLPKEINGLMDQTTVTAVSPDWHLLAISSDSNNARRGGAICLYPVYREPSGVRIDSSFVVAAAAHSERQPARCLTFSPDGRLLASVGQDGIVHLWETATGKERLHFVGHGGPIRTLSFSPDGRRLATGGDDTTVLVWDVTGGWLDDQGRLQPALVSARQTERLWQTLGSADAVQAGRALWKLTAAGSSTVDFLKARLWVAPDKKPSAKALAQLIADLDSDVFAVRKRALKELRKLGAVIEPDLHQVLAKGASVEVRFQVKNLLKALEKERATLSAETLRNLRAIEALEHMGGKAACQLLEALSHGPGARETQEAQAALDRLGRR